MSDLHSILRGNIKFPFGISSKKRKSIGNYDLNKYSNSLYLRFEVNDKPGVLSQITHSLAKKNISVDLAQQITSYLEEKNYLETIKNLGITTILIAHRREALDVCNKILLMNDGTITDQGRVNYFKDK